MGLLGRNRAGPSPFLDRHPKRHESGEALDVGVVGDGDPDRADLTETNSMGDVTHWVDVIRILPHTSLSTGLADINPNLCKTMASSQHKIFRDQAGALLISLQSSLQ